LVAGGAAEALPVRYRRGDWGELAGGFPAIYKPSYNARRCPRIISFIHLDKRVDDLERTPKRFQ